MDVARPRSEGWADFLRRLQAAAAAMYDTCGTCIWQERRTCRNRRSAFFGWTATDSKRGCHFYKHRRAGHARQLPQIGGGLEEPREEEGNDEYGDELVREL